MSNVLKFNNVIRVAKLTADPSNAEEGMLYYNTTNSVFRFYQSGSFQTVDTADLAGGKFGTLNQGSNYTAGTVGEVGSHLDAIDTALASAGGSEFDDATFKIVDLGGDSLGLVFDVSAVTSADKTITMPDANVDLADVNGSVTAHSDMTDAGSGAVISSSERTKLSGIEALADVTDATNVDAAGAVMEADTSTASMGFVVDEDDMNSDSATKLATQQSIKAYVDAEVAAAVASEMSYKGGYNASTNTPDLDTSPSGVALGDMYTVTAAGTFFTTAVEIGDVLIAEAASATTEAEWTIVNKNLDAASIKTSYESNSDTNAYTDAEKTTVGNQSGTNTGDESSATDSAEGIVELATQGEVDTGSDASRVITPATLAGSALATAANSALQNLVDDTAPSLGGDLTLGANVMIHDGDGIKKGSSASNFYEEEYIHATTLTASQTDTVASAFTFATASFEGAILDYKIKEATTNNVRVGKIMVATDGTNISISDTFTETADIGVGWNASINTGNVELEYTTTANNKTMRCVMQRIKT
jgi:hypothetical protein